MQEGSLTIDYIITLKLAGINPDKQLKADLEALYNKHLELFSKPSDVWKLMQAIKDNSVFLFNFLLK